MADERTGVDRDAGQPARRPERAPSVAELVRRRVLHSHERFWVPSDFADLPRRRALRALGRLEESGELRRVRRGLYWRAHTLAGGRVAPPPLDLVAKVIGIEHGIGPAGASAAHLLGLRSRRPSELVIAVPARAPREIQGVSVLSRAGRQGRITKRLTPHEVALLEILEDERERKRAGAEELKAALGRCRPAALASAAASEPAIVRQGLINLLELAGASEAATAVPECFGALARERAWRP